MSTRLMMLFLLVGAFIVIWSGDDQGAERTQTHSESGRESQRHRLLSVVRDSSVQSISVTLRFETGADESSGDLFEPGSREHGYGIACLPETAWKPSRYDGAFAIPNRAEDYQAQFASFMNGESWEAAPVKVGSPDPEHVIPMQDCDIPLPVDLSPGEYRIVNTRGAVYWKRWSAEELSYLGVPDSVARLNLYMLEEEGQKWFFVRVQPSKKPIPDPIETTIPVTEFSDWKKRLSASPDDSDAAADMIFFAIERIAKSAGRIGDKLGAVRLEIQRTISQAAGNWAVLVKSAIRNGGGFPSEPRNAALPISSTDETSLKPIRTSDKSNRFECREFY